MEHRAVQLMSRKQRAAKILTGDTGLTGLDALTEGEGGFEAALLNAITETDALVDPRDLFTQDVIDDAITSEDNAFWNVEVDDAPSTAEIILPEPVLIKDFVSDLPVLTPAPVMPVKVVAKQGTVAQKKLANLIVSEDDLDAILSVLENPSKQDVRDELVTFARDELGAVVRGDSSSTNPPDIRKVAPSTAPEYIKQLQFVSQYLEQYPNTVARSKWTVALLSLIREGVWDDRAEVKQVAGIEESSFLQSPAMQKRLHSSVRSYLRQHQLVPHDVSSEVAKRVIELSLMALNMIPIQLDIFASLRINKKQEVSKRNPRKSPKNSSKRKDKLNLMAIPDDRSVDALDSELMPPKQLAFF